MSDAEEIAAAIEKLFPSPTGSGWVAQARAEKSLRDALDRTLPAQLKLLTEAALDTDPGYVGDCAYPAAVLELARAINGTTNREVTP